MKKQYQAIRHYRDGVKIPVHDGRTRYFDTEREAREAAKADIKKEKSRNPIIIGGISIIHKHRRELDIVKYGIRKREITPWEIIDEIEVDPKQKPTRGRQPGGPGKYKGGPK